jgi:hypothetical protein
VITQRSIADDPELVTSIATSPSVACAKQARAGVLAVCWRIAVESLFLVSKTLHWRPVKSYTTHALAVKGSGRGPRAPARAAPYLRRRLLRGA